MPDHYRACASMLLLRPKDVCSPDGCGSIVEVLLLHKPRKRDAWQLPQGGVEKGETVEQAALRELREEAGISARIIGASKRVYQYDFPASYRRFRPDQVCGQAIRFVFAVPDSADPVVVDGREIDAFLWVLSNDLPRHLKRKQYLRLVMQIVDEAKGLLQHGKEEGENAQ